MGQSAQIDTEAARPEALEAVGKPGARPSRRPPPNATIGRDVHCGACWYNLRGLAFIGRCPECGTRYKAWNNARRQNAAESKYARERYLHPITNIPIGTRASAAWALVLLVLMLFVGSCAAVFLIWAARAWWLSW